ncbi:GntR family transcriptional regulator [Ottowia thiooxydans]|uniref:GntR family transcriptional regulator n=1 Tax=Ottowia thiooxydans TaxID=219182 RepID=UPI000427BEDF|nr:FCD domain-containing protein [Ottowia thiooxydans]
MNYLLPQISTDFSEVRNTTLGTLVRNRLLSKILSGDLTPGQALREPEIVEELQVSRVPVREALRQLESMGLVVARKNRGVSVRTLTDKEVSDLYDFRGLLEGFAGQQMALREASERTTLATQLDLLCGEMDDAISQDDAKKYYHSNLRFHWAFIEALGNEEIENTYREITQKLHLARFKNLQDPAHRKHSNDEHKLIAAALRDGGASTEPQPCAALLVAHVKQALVRLRQI